MKRRNTLGGALGPLSPSQANVQRPHAVSRPSIKGEGDQGPQKARRSLAPAKDERRYSQESRRRSNNHARKQDSRNLSDKAFQHAAVRNIISCLTSLGYNQQVTPKTLQLPSAKDFNGIARFMMQALDIDYPIEGKLEDEMPAFLQMHGYPFPLNRNSLITVGAPHTWPHVLGALAWLADMISYAKRTDDEIPNADAELVEDITFVMSAGEMYNSWMNNDDVVWQRELHQQLEALGKGRQEVEAQLEQERQEVKRLEAEVQKLRTRPGPVQLARDQLLAAEQKQSKTDAALRNISAALKQAKQRLQHEAADATAKATQLEALEKEVQALQGQVAAQPVNKLEVESMMQQRYEQAKKLDMLKSKLHDAQREEREAAASWQKRVEQLNRHVEQYNELAYRLKLTPENAKRAHGTSLELHVVQHVGDSSGSHIINLDLKGQVVPLLDKIDKEMDARSLEAIRQHGEAKIQHDKETEKLAALKASLEQLRKQVEEADQSCNEVVANKERVVQERQRDAMGLQTDPSNIDTQLQRELEEKEKQRAQLEHDQLQYEQECRKKVAALSKELAAARELVKKGKAEAMGQLLASAQKARELRRRVEAAPTMAQHTLPVECKAILDRHSTR